MKIRLRPLFVALILAYLTLPLFAQELISVEFKAERSRAYMTSNYGFFMENGVRLYAITYTTVDLEGAKDTASGLVVVPVRAEEFAFPTICYLHGTVSDRNDVPSRLEGGYQAAEALGGMGFVTIAPDFLGLGTSRGVHPYVHADSEAWVSVDMLSALKEFGLQQEVFLNEQLFITGYSQGGHAAMALQRSVEMDPIDSYRLVASAPLSGPYSISTSMVHLMIGDQAYNFVAYLPHTLIGYNEVYKLYDDVVEEVFDELYVPLIRSFQEEAINLSQLNSALLQSLMTNTGSTVPRNLMREEFLSTFSEDPENPLFQALLDNDVYDWSPQVPTRLFYCKADDQVPYTNSVRADSVMNSNGASDLQALDLNSDFDHGQCVEPALINTVFFFLQYRDLALDVTNSKFESSRLEFFPNPAASFVRFKNPGLDMEVKIFDTQGRLILAQYVSNGEINISHLSPGLYLIQGEDAQGRVNTGRLIKH